MANRHVRCAIMAGLLTINLAGIAAANERAQEATIPEKGEATLVGCFLRERIHNDDKYVLTDARVGPATSVTAAACSAGGTGRMIKLEKVKKHHLEVVNVGQWVEVTGDLRKMHKPSDLQDMHVTSFRPVPVIVPVAEALPPAPESPRLVPTPPTAPQAEAPAPPAPVATTGVMTEKPRRLPASASSLPLTALIGFGALAGGLVLLFNRRRAEGRS